MCVFVCFEFNTATDLDYRHFSCLLSPSCIGTGDWEMSPESIQNSTEGLQCKSATVVTQSSPEVPFNMMILMF